MTTASPTGLLPVLLAPYRDLTELRYDYPVVLVDGDPHVESLTDVTNRAVRRVAARGAAGESTRRRALRVEAAIRRRVAGSGRGPLSELWKLATADVLATCPDDAAFADQLDLVRNAITIDGTVLDCDEHIASDVVQHVWAALHEQAARRAGRRVDELILRLSGILEADEAHSPAGCSPERLSTALGGDHRADFDFEAWSALLRRRPDGAALPDTRRSRIRSVLDELTTQRFFPAQHRADDRHPSQFHSCVAAIDAHRERAAARARLVRAMAIAELEADNRYRETEHDGFFREFDERSVDGRDFGLFPSSLVTIGDADLSGDEHAALFELLGSELPIKVLVEVHDALGEPATHIGAPPGRTLASMAIGLGTAFVLQTASSHLFQARADLAIGLDAAGPALFSVYVPAADDESSLSPYLAAAAAVQSRLVPAFVFDPGAGTDWAARFRLDANPQPDDDWPSATVSFEDADLQHRSEPSAFTMLDVAALDPRYARNFTAVPGATSPDDMVPAVAALRDGDPDADDRLPYVVMVSDDDVIQRLTVDRELLRRAQRVGATWRSLQELAGIRNSHALALLATERARWDDDDARERLAEPGAVDPEPAASPPAQPTTTIGPLPDEAPPEDAGPPSGQPWIETARCTTCDECTTLNPDMFAYDENKQAYIADLSAGTYRDMVTAAEACQVAIIHAGTPWDPTEPGLDELVARAEALG